MATHEDGQLMIQLLRWGNELGLEEAYTQIFAEDFDKDKASPSDPLIGRILTYGEAVGTFVKHGLLDRNLVNDFWASGLVWSLVAPAALQLREIMGEAALGENFEALAMASPV